MKLLVALKHLFIPHDKNDYKPHFFRELSVAIILFASIFLLGASVGSALFIHKTILGANIAAEVLIDLTNQSRLAFNELPLTRSSKLNEAAQMKGNDMAKFGYFAHISPDGVTPWHWFKEVGYNFLYAGENLAINFTEATDVEKAWLDSPTHRANLLNVKFREIGIATVEGAYNNIPTIFVVQMFGTPAYSAAVNVSDEQTSTTTQNNPATLTADKVVVESEKSTSTPKLALVNGEVKGEETREIVPVFQPVITTNELAIVKNTSTVELPSTTAQMETYSTWYGRLLFSGPHFVDVILKILIFIVAIALVTMILIEVKKQHFKHTLYGVILLIILTVFVYINRGFF